MDTTFSWLGRFPLAVDLADTVRVVGGAEVDLLAGDDDVARWVAIEQPRFPSAAHALGHSPDVRTLRGNVRELLFATAEGRPSPAPARTAINRASTGNPAALTLDEHGHARYEHVGRAGFAVFAADVARSAIELVTGTDGRRLAVCRSPGCGMFFLRADRRQRWCSDACGNRARVARHAARRNGQG